MSLILLQKEKHTRRREVTYTSSYQGQKLKRLAKPETGVCFPSHSREQNPRKLGFPLCNPSTLQELQRLCSARLCQQKLSEGCCFKFPTWRLCCVSCKESQRGGALGIYRGKQQAESLTATPNTATPAANPTANTVLSAGL